MLSVAYMQILSRKGAWTSTQTTQMEVMSMPYGALIMRSQHIMKQAVIFILNQAASMRQSVSTRHANSTR